VIERRDAGVLDHVERTGRNVQAALQAEA